MINKSKNKAKQKSQPTVKELEHDFPSLLPPTENIEENLARGTAGGVPDPDDIPGGFNMNGTQRPDMEEAEAEAEQEFEKGEKHE